MFNYSFRRNMMKSGFGTLDYLSMRSDKEKQIPHPAPEQHYYTHHSIISLPPPDATTLADRDIFSCLSHRESRRTFSDLPLTLEELSFLLWSVNGVRVPTSMQRIVPSAGNCHAYDTYIVANNIDRVAGGIYYYHGMKHRLRKMGSVQAINQHLSECCCAQSWIHNASLILIWVCNPYRGEWRFKEQAHKLMLIDAGHMGQNLYLATEAIHGAMVTIGAYHQKKIDTLLHLDSENSFVTYMAAVGKRK